MAGLVRQLCRELGDVPLGMVLEGGYELGALARSVAATLQGTTTRSSLGELDLHPLTATAAAGLAPRWPTLAAVSAGARRT
jgi:acetoin utilization deacetylase AcuC-like enzyme